MTHNISSLVSRCIKSYIKLLKFLLFIKAAIWHALNHYAFNDAAFLAERLYAEGKCVFWGAQSSNILQYLVV